MESPESRKHKLDQQAEKRESPKKTKPGDVAQDPPDTESPKQSRTSISISLEKKYWIPDVYLLPQNSSESTMYKLQFGNCLLHLIDCDDMKSLERQVCISQGSNGSVLLKSARETSEPDTKRKRLNDSPESDASQHNQSSVSSTEKTDSSSTEGKTQQISGEQDSSSTMTSSSTNSSTEWFGPVPLGHPVYCPMLTLKTEIDQEVTQERKDNLLERVQALCERKSLKVAVCVLVERLNGDVLLTRRSESLQIFPSAWVNPGGHVDEGETLEDAGLREVDEETGIHKNLIDSIKPLCLWESVYPTKVQYGLPKVQHVILFYHAKLNTDDVSLVMEESEVDMCAWLTRDLIKSFISEKGNQHLMLGGVSPASKTVPGIAFSKDKQLSEIDIDVAQFCGIYPNVNNQGIGNAHRFALRNWCYK